MVRNLHCRVPLETAEGVGRLVELIQPRVTGHMLLQEEAILDDIIDRLLDVRNGRPGKQVQLTEQEIRQLCLTAKEIFMSQPNLLELEAPIKICGKNREVSRI